MRMLLQWLLPFAAFASSFANPESRYGLNLVRDYSSCEMSLTGELNKPPSDAEHGLVTPNVEMTMPNLLLAYERGIFPWGQSGIDSAEWFNPPFRGIMELKSIHIPRSDRKFIRKAVESGEYQITFDRAFSDVIQECAKQVRWTIDERTGERIVSKPWLTELFVKRYIELHKAGYAHSVEVWRDGELVAGLYGVFVKGMFSGESMFHDPERGSGATKLALAALIDRLRQRGHEIMDTQMAVGLAGKWGAKYVRRDTYMSKLRAAQLRNLSY
ncbi:MAG: GNAT family N-acetyltransferase [Bdellovibrionales bacterium]|nr:GNAT family N-acetyltransferase [Bdellovibrionales bacterium]